MEKLNKCKKFLKEKVFVKKNLKDIMNKIIKKCKKFLKENIFVKKNVEDKESKIINKWKEKWEEDYFYIKGEYKVVNKKEESDCFLEWLIATMIFLKRKIKVNKIKNFVLKRISITMPLIMVVMVYIIQKNFSIAIIPNEEASGEFKNWIFFLVIVLLPSYVVKKWIDVKKYQETWARYTKTRSAILCQMTRYIYKINEYSSVFRKTIFLEKIINIVDSNVEKFNDNMTNKEKEVFQLSEIANLIKGE